MLFSASAYWAYEDEDVQPQPQPPTDDHDEPKDLEEAELLAFQACEEEYMEDNAAIASVIQAEIKAYMAFGQAMKGGKGYGKGQPGKFGGKGKGKTRKFGFRPTGRPLKSLEERKEDLKRLKAKTKCVKCGEIGHWTGDEACKKKTAMMVYKTGIDDTRTCYTNTVCEGD